jgi:AbrB family looped-hinge helix DNA binding protein
MAMICTIDAAGRLVIRKELRERLHLRGGCRIQMTEDGGRIVLEPVEETDGLDEHDGLLIATGVTSGPWPDHRSIRDERLRKLGGR